MMDQEEARKILDAEIAINAEISEMNRKYEEYGIYVYKLQGHIDGLEQIADALQLTRTYKPYISTNGEKRIFIDVNYKGMDFMDAI